MWSILCQCTSEKSLHIFLMIKLYLCALYSNEFVKKFFSFMKLVKSDWCSKLSGENIEALLHIKVEGPKIK